MSRPSSLTAQLLATAAILAWGLAPAGPATGRTLRLREVLQCDEPSRADYERMERGYYQHLIDAGRRQLGAPAGVEDTAPATAAAAPFEAGPLVMRVDDLREFVLKPNMSSDHGGVRWSTNALGMRDRDYAPSKPPDTFRIAFVGDSIGCGWGVNEGERFETIVERRLDERSRRAGGPAIEILNFAVPGHGPGQRWTHFARIGWGTAPDLLIFESTLADAGWDERRLRGNLPRGIGWDSPLYREALAASGARPGGTSEEYKRVLRPYREAFLQGVYRAAVADCRARGVPCALILVPRVGRAADPAERQQMVATALDAGFAPVIDLTDAYDGLDPATLAVRPDDFHPNADGHTRLARRLVAALERQQALGRLRLTTGPSEGAESP